MYNETMKRPVTVFLYDRTKDGKKSPGIIAAEITARKFPYIQIGGIYIDKITDDEIRPAFDKMMNACDYTEVDFIAVPSEDCLSGSMDLMFDTYKSVAERGLDVFDLERDERLHYEELWDSLVGFANRVLDFENR